MLIGLLFNVLSGYASQDYYYQATANADVSGGGKVYVSDTETNSPAYANAPQSIEGFVNGLSSAEGAYATIHFYASNEEGFRFLGWKNSAGNTVSTNTHFTATDQWVDGTREWKGLPIIGHWEYHRTQITYTAIFEEIQGYVQVYSTDPSRGTVDCSDYNNTLHEEITITAIPDASQGVKFLGWKTSNSESAAYVSSANPYELTVTGRANYYAFFSPPATMVYCILKNKGTGRYLSLYGDVKAGTHSSQVTYNGSPYNVNDGFIFDKGLKMIAEDKALGNPMIVFKRKSTTLSGTLEEGDLATDVKDESNKAISVSTLIGNQNYPLTFEHQNDGSYKIYTNYSTRVQVGITSHTITLQSCLYDDGTSDYATMQAIDNMNANSQAKAYWDIYFLTEEQVEGAFGANAKAKFTQENKYYTTMYAPFAYKLLDGVTAYYLPFSSESYNQEKNKLIFKKIASGSVVPANTAVILECQNSDDPTKNRLLPVAEATPITGATNQLLKGYTQLYSRASNGLINTVANSDLRYILSMNDAGKLGFYHYSGNSMNPNKAFLELPASLDELAQYLEEHNNAENLAKTITFSFGEPEDNFGNSVATGLELFNQIVDEDDSTPVYDLNGSKIAKGKAVENILRPGIYVKKGKKFVIK